MDPDLVAALDRLKGQFVSGPYGYLRNPVRVPGVTCPVCTEPLHNNFLTCYNCNQHCRRGGDYLADLTGFGIYAINDPEAEADSQSARLMERYKGEITGPQAPSIVLNLAFLSIAGHIQCAEKLVGTETNNWATVPSLKGRTGVHPLRQIVTQFMPAAFEVNVEASPFLNAANHRQYRPTNFHVTTPVTPGSHVLAIDDTWTTGAHAQSFAGALKQAGAGKVSFLSIARWLNRRYRNTNQFLNTYVNTQNFDPAICPWTAGQCP